MADRPLLARRGFLAGAMAMVPALSARGEGGDSAVPVLRGADFLDSLGVNTHLRYANSQYNDLGVVRRALEFCGFRHVRDTAISASAPNAAHYGALAEAGVSFCLFWGVGRTMDDAIGQIAELESRHPGAVWALEGPNEIQARFAYSGQIGLAAGRQFIEDMRARASAQPSLKSKPIVSFSSFAPASSVSDFANHHPYPKNGIQPRALLKMRRDQWVGPGAPMAGKPMVFTEFGYHTLVGRPLRPAHWQGVDEEVQAALILNGLFDAASLGVKRTYVYQLLDGATDRSGAPSQENHFGLFRADGAPKVSAQAIRRLSSFLADSGHAVRGPAGRGGDIDLASDPDVRALSLRKTNGERLLALWNEASIWDKDSAARMEAPAARVDLTGALGGRALAVDLITGQAIPLIQEANRVRLEINFRPVLIRFA